jgi:hypothetical protein
MSNLRIIRALELIHQAKIAHVVPAVCAPLLDEAEDELLRHIAEAKKAEQASV